MKMISATIIRMQSGADIVSIRTDLPVGIWPFDEKERLHLEFRIARGGGPEYMKTHFPELPIEVL